MLLLGLTFVWKNEIIIITRKKETKMAVPTTAYKVGDTYTSQKSKVTGIIKELVPTDKNTIRVRLDVNGETRWTTWKSK